MPSLPSVELSEAGGRLALKWKTEIRAPRLTHW
jgi:hypothetical protein